MRISGFASGMDIDSMVKELMQAKREPLNKLNQQKQLLDWKREAYRELSSKMVGFTTNKLSTLKNTLSVEGKTAALTGDTSAISVRVSNSATSTPVKVEISQAATAASNEITFANATRDTKLDTILGSTDPTSIFVNGKEIKIDNPAEMTMQSLVNQINKTAGSEVSATFDSASSKLVIASKKVGASSAVSVSANLLNQGTSVPKPGQDAIFSINGVSSTDLIDKGAITIDPSNSNIINYDGMQITLLNGPAKAGDPALSVTIQAKPDSEKLLTAVKSFIDEYNTLISSFNTKIGEERYRKYAPLTEDQKKEMKDDDITLWQNKAKSGMLKNDDIIGGLVSDMRLAVTGSVSTAQGEVSIFDMGISTGKWNEGGKLVIENEDRLKQMIEQDADKIISFFSSVGSSVSSDEKKQGIRFKEDTGLFNRVSSLMNDSLTRLAERAGTSRISSDANSEFLVASQMGEQSRNLDLRISNMIRKINNLETNYYKQFTAMETAINKYNAQSSSLSSFL